MGAVQWSRDLDADQLVTIASDDVIVLTNATRRVGLDAATGDELWQAETPSTDEVTSDDHDGLSVEARGADEIIVPACGRWWDRLAAVGVRVASSSRSVSAS